MTYYSMKNRQLSWLYVNHERREYLGGNYLVAESESPASPTSITTNLLPQSAVGASLLLLITPFSRIDDGHPLSHDLRGTWAGHHIVTVNNKMDPKLYSKVEGEYDLLSLSCMDFLRDTNDHWDKVLYENANEFWVLRPPRGGNING